MKDNNLNIQEKLQEFHKNSLIIKDFHPKILARLDSNNVEVYIERVSKTNGEAYISDSCFYGSVKKAIERSFKFRNFER